MTKTINIGKVVSYLLVTFGISAIALSFGADLLGFGGEKGMGLKQGALAVAGLIALVCGTIFLLPGSRLAFQMVISPSEESGKPVSILFLSIWFGLLTGFGEVVVLLYQRVFDNNFFMRSHHFPWMIPLGEVSLFIIPGVILLLVTSRWLQPAWIYFAFFVFSFMGYFNILILFEQLHIFAQFLLAIGLAVQTARLIMSHQKNYYSLVRFSLGWLVTGVFILSVGFLLIIP